MTAANVGIGGALVKALLDRGAGKLYAVARINGTYCAFNAAGHSLLQGLCAELAPRNIQVVAAIFAGLVNGDEDIFPAPMSQGVHAGLMKNPKQVEKKFAALIQA